MGANRFDNFHQGTDLSTTFTAAHEQGLYDHGHSGYSGSIAEKGSVVLRSDKVMTIREAEHFADDDLQENDHDKWGACWAVKVKDEKAGEGFLFYGYASS